jgi:hypothetical protein
MDYLKRGTKRGTLAYTEGRRPFRQLDGPLVRAGLATPCCLET